MPEDAIINLLKTLPEDVLIDIFWKTIVEVDVSPLTAEEKEEIKKAKDEYGKGETIKWENLK
ncbi:MAG: hypothetical protein JG778_1521 [Thermodesulfobacterium sp.]|nr:hypothetical protein [Thermodesulfobacterium sp.]